jgi:hypothetical protein
MLELAAERALGAHPYFVPVEHTAFARKRLGPEPLLAVEQTAVLASDPAEARRVARQFAVHYLQTTNYANNLRRMGWSDQDIGGKGSDAIIDAIVAWGDADRIATRVRAHLEAGADHVCVQVVSDDENDVCLAQLRELAPALLPLWADAAFGLVPAAVGSGGALEQAHSSAAQGIDASGGRPRVVRRISSAVAIAAQFRCRLRFPIIAARLTLPS